jgi:hypothetical protein
MQYDMVLIFFIYGLAFFSMGLAITLEANRGSDTRLRHGLRALAIFGILHGIHEWVEMFELLNLLPGHDLDPVAWHTARIAMLEFSFLFLAAFGATLLPRVKNYRRASIVVPMALATIWGIGIVVLRSFFTIDTGLCRSDRTMARLQKSGDGAVWTRSTVGRHRFCAVRPAGSDIRAGERFTSLNGDQPRSLLAHFRFSYSATARGRSRGISLGGYSLPAVI